MDIAYFHVLGRPFIAESSLCIHARAGNIVRTASKCVSADLVNMLLNVTRYCCLLLYVPPPDSNDSRQQCNSSTSLCTTSVSDLADFYQVHHLICGIRSRAQLPRWRYIY